MVKRSWFSRFKSSSLSGARNMSDTVQTNAAIGLSDQIKESESQEVKPITEYNVTDPAVIADASWQVAVANWWNEHVRNSPIAANTELLNHLGGILPHLKAFVEKELGSSPPAA